MHSVASRGASPALRACRARPARQGLARAEQAADRVAQPGIAERVGVVGPQSRAVETSTNDRCPACKRSAGRDRAAPPGGCRRVGVLERVVPAASYKQLAHDTLNLGEDECVVKGDARAGQEVRLPELEVAPSARVRMITV